MTIATLVSLLIAFNAPPAAPAAPTATPHAGGPVLASGSPAPDLTIDSWVKGDEVKAFDPDKVYVVEFWATWCGPCRMMSPTVDTVATEYAGRAKVGKLNVDENASIAGRFGIRSIPTLLLFKGGQIQEQLVGTVPKEALSRLLDKYLA